MMGLLDYGSDITDDPRQLGLLSLGLRLMSTPGKFGQALGTAGQGALGDMAAAKQAKLKEEFMRVQMADMKAQEAQRLALAEKERMRAQRDAEFRAGLLPMPITGGQAAGMPGGMSPQNAALVGTRSPPDWAQLARRFPDKIDEIVKLSSSGDLGLPKVARTDDIEGSDGTKIRRSFDDRNRPVGPDQSGYVAPVLVDQGSKATFARPAAGVSLPKFKSPGTEGGGGGGTPYFIPVPTTQGVGSFNARTGQIEMPTVGGAPAVRPADDPKRQGEIAQAKEAGKALGEEIGLLPGKVQALESVRGAAKILDQGIYTGTYADIKKFIAKATPGDADKAARTEQFLSHIGNVVIPRLKEFGGNDSNEELRYLQKVMGGEIKMEEKAIRGIVKDSERKIAATVDRLTKAAASAPSAPAATSAHPADIAEILKRNRGQ